MRCPEEQRGVARVGSRLQAGFSHRDLAKLPPLPTASREATTPASEFQRIRGEVMGSSGLYKDGLPGGPWKSVTQTPGKESRAVSHFSGPRSEHGEGGFLPGRAGSPGHPETAVLSLAFARLASTQTHKHTNAHQPSRPPAEGQSRSCQRAQSQLCRPQGAAWRPGTPAPTGHTRARTHPGSSAAPCGPWEPPAGGSGSQPTPPRGSLPQRKCQKTAHHPTELRPSSRALS